MDVRPVVADDGGMRHAPLLRLAAGAGLALALAGCGSAGAPPADPGPAGTSAPSTSTSSASAASTTGTPTPSLTDPPTNGKAMTVTMTGTIEDGVESGCLVFTDEATGETYSITSDRLPGSAAALGSRVTVTGTVDPDLMSFCQQGPVLLVDEVTEPAD